MFWSPLEGLEPQTVAFIICGLVSTRGYLQSPMNFQVQNLQSPMDYEASAVLILSLDLLVVNANKMVRV